MRFLSLKKLEEKMPKYKDLLSVPIRNRKERFIAINKKLIPCGYLDKLNDMNAYLNGQIMVRLSIFEKLLKIQSELQKINSRYSLFVSYGYRSLNIQIKYFLKQLQIILKSTYFPNPTDLYEEVHRSIAVPTVAGHPTGGAIDVFIINKKTRRPLDFGSSIYDFSSKKSYSFYPSIPYFTKKNRLFLRNLMMKYNFAPFDGEWWHFSYGDKEWAFYYKKKFAFYDQAKLE